MGTGMMAFVALAVLGVVILVTTAGWRPYGPDIGEFLDDVAVDGYERRTATPFLRRVSAAAARAVAARVERMLPHHYLKSLEQQLVLAGIAHRRRAGEQLAHQMVAAVAGAGLALLLLAAGMGTSFRIPLLALLPTIGFILPSARLKRQGRARSDRIFKDLPDIIDMMAIAVEAGSGFEAAMSLVCEHFDSPFTDELAIALQAMELGMPRREALQELRARSDLDVVRTFVVALVQADGLGVPIGRVLKAQAAELRARRRAWAREKAAKLPIKILFPLTLFIFPPILAIVMGPAAGAFLKVG